jgi:hypothetical protein
MASVPQVSTNEFNNSQTLLGQLALAINSNRVVAGTLGGAATAQVGSRVSIDTTVTTPGVVRFLPCADATPAFGVIIWTPQEGTINPGDNIEVAFVGGNCMTQVGSTTLTPGTLVGLSNGFLVTQSGSNAQMGILIDYVTNSTAGRVILGWSAS